MGQRIKKILDFLDFGEKDLRAFDEKINH